MQYKVSVPFWLLMMKKSLCIATLFTLSGCATVSDHLAYTNSRLEVLTAKLGAYAESFYEGVDKIFGPPTDAPDEIIAVNKKWNALKQDSDMNVWGVSDYWASPSETLSKGVGDCEDLAIGKFFDLKDLGPDYTDVRLLAVKSPVQSHMLVTVKHKKATYVLDSLLHYPYELSQLPDFYQVLYSINEQNIKMGGQGKIEVDSEKISKWVDMFERHKKAQKSSASKASAPVWRDFVSFFGL